jgi:hypothetical protein
LKAGNCRRARSDGDDIRLVLAELINPTYDLRNVAGLCTAAALDCAKVKAALTLGQSKAATGKNFEVWQAPWTDAKKGAHYTLKSRKPVGTDGSGGDTSAGYSTWFLATNVPAPGYQNRRWTSLASRP